MLREKTALPYDASDKKLEQDNFGIIFQISAYNICYDPPFEPSR